jgi:class 3 adenylate cyclase/tetratricopeptide (TPR) repeat protein
LTRTSLLAEPHTGALDCYVPQVVLRRLAQTPEELVQTLHGTVVCADISGFARLSERLARSGTEGAEYLVDTINSCFSTLLVDAYADGGSLLKFGGDALVLWFEGEEHAVRGCSSAISMRRTLRRIGRITAGTSEIVLRMSVGVHSGAYHMFLAGGSHRELVIGGPAVSTVVAMEAAASSGQILASPATADLLPRRWLGTVCGPGVLVSRAASVPLIPAAESPWRPPDDAIAGCLSTALRALLGSRDVPEHRTATVAFLQFDGLDDLIGRQGPQAAALEINHLMRVAQESADRYEVCILGSDIAYNGGRLLFSAGAPLAKGDDEERMLLCLRGIVEQETPLPIHAGVNWGHVFTGEVGPTYSRTYAVMGDAVNLAARLMDRAPSGCIYATRPVLDRSRTRFRQRMLEPFKVKGKGRPVQAWELGPAIPAAASAVAPRLPLIGRHQELDRVEMAIEGARRGQGELVELVGEAGHGKSRLLSEARELADGMRFVHTTCEPYTHETPYAAWRDPLRQLMGCSQEDSEAVVLARVRTTVRDQHADLLQWLPLLAIAFGAGVVSSTKVDELAPEARAAKLHEVVLRFLSRELVVPTLFEIEHAHLMDAASAALLEALAWDLDSSAWVVFVTRRDENGGFIAPQPPGWRIELGPLSAEESLSLAHAAPAAGELAPHVVELAIERSGGNPEFLLDLMAAAVAGGDALPDSVEAAAMARLDALPSGDRALVRRAAVLGLTFHPGRLRDVLDPGMPVPDDAVWERLSGVFERNPDGHIRFKRPVLSDVAYASLPFKLRRALHASVGQSLELDQGQDLDADPAALSLHFLRAGDHSRARRYAMLGAKRATERFSHADAARLYRRAIEASRAGAMMSEPGQVEALAEAWEQLGDALRCTGEPDAASRALTEARRLAGEDPLVQARLCHRHAEVAERSESLTAAVRWLMRGLRLLDGIPSAEATIWRARLRSYLGGVRNRQGRWLEAAQACCEAIAEAEPAGELRALAQAWYALDWALVELGRPEQATNSWRALEIYRRLGDPEHESTVLNNLGMFAYFQGRWGDAVDLYRKSGACSERAGKPGNVARTDCNVGEVLSDQGHLDEAAGHLERARLTWTATGDRQSVAFINVLLGRLASRRGHFHEALPLLETAMAELRRFGIAAYADFAQALIAEAEAFAGDPSRALQGARQAAEGSDRNVPLVRRVAGIALARLDLGDEAEAELKSALEAARERGAEYDFAATADVLDALGRASPELCHQRDEILGRLNVQQLPTPRLPVRRQVGTGG